MNVEQADSWSTPRKVLVVLAHPDDPEFFCGGTLARWARRGHHIEYVLLTCGDKGYNDFTTVDMINTDDLCAARHVEQNNAAAVLGVESVEILGNPDGYLVPDIGLRREVVRMIRKSKPDILLTCDPQTLFTSFGINHPDHRAAGQVAMDAAYPAAGNAAYFPELLAEGLAPNMPKQIWCSLTMQPNVVLDVTETWPTKMEALLCHKTQVGDDAKFRERMMSRHTDDSDDENPRFEEKFRVVSYE